MPACGASALIFMLMMPIRIILLCLKLFMQLAAIVCVTCISQHSTMQHAHQGILTCHASAAL